jgi:hypothetical protein
MNTERESRDPSEMRNRQEAKGNCVVARRGGKQPGANTRPRGQTPHDARKLQSRENLCLPRLLAWAKAEFTAEDLFLMEAGSNSFAICEALEKLGLRAVVLESAHVGKHAKTYAE